MDDLYFAYGSNMNLAQMARRCPGAQLGIQAELPGWRYFINGNGYAGIEKFSGGLVRGRLWSLLPQHWEALDQYEGVAGGYYEKKKMEVLSSRNGEQLPVWVYLSNDYEYGTPSSSYQEIVVQGARDVNLPESYLPVLEVWADGPPPSFFR
jgi:gamma-glutamylcyclotransferase (GGCT)/AIG2-like uncharacterized protein YtfP